MELCERPDGPVSNLSLDMPSTTSHFGNARTGLRARRNVADRIVVMLVVRAHAMARHREATGPAMFRAA